MMGLNKVDAEPDVEAVPSATVPSKTAGSGPKQRELLASAATALAFLAVFAFYALWLGGEFYDVNRLAFDLSRSAPQIVLAVAVAAALCANQFDLSVASVATASCFMTMGLYLDGGLPMWVAIVAAVASGVIAGVINGVLVTWFGVNAFIATLGTGGVFAGFTVVYSSGRVIGPTAATEPLPTWFSGVGSIGDFQTKAPLVVALVLVAGLVAAALLSLDQRFPSADEGAQRTRRVVGAVVGVVVVAGAWQVDLLGAIDWMIVILLALTLVVWMFMKYTAAGQAVYAVGGSNSAASFAGIRVRRVSLLAFVFSATVAAFVGVLLAAQQGSASPGLADPLLLPAYAGAFLSTVVLSRGRFHMWGTVAGSAALVYVTSGLVTGGVPYTWTQVINGLVLITAVSLSTYLGRTKSRH